MNDSCCCTAEAGSATCDLRPQSPQPSAIGCPACGQNGKVVQRQTVQALLARSLRLVVAAEYRFCRTPTCAVVYFTTSAQPVFMVADLREQVYQKAPDAAAGFVCYCFRYTVGALQATTPATAAAVLADITAGIDAGECACDLRNPQGSCCLGNVRRLIAQQHQRAAGVPHA